MRTLSPARLLLGLGVAIAVLALGQGAARLLPPGPAGVPAGLALSLALLLSWLVLPAGGGVTLRALLAPFPERAAAAGLLALALWAVGLALVSVAFGEMAASLDPPGTARRLAEPGELLRQGAIGLGAAALHGALCLAWPLSAESRRGRAAAAAILLSAALAGATLLLLGAGWPVALAAATTAALATPVMLIPVLMGGRAWPLVPVNALALLLPLLASGIPVLR